MKKIIFAIFISILFFGCASSKIMFTEGDGIPHKDFKDEFLSHKKCSEWWYATGYLEDNDGYMFSYQFTLARVKIGLTRLHMLLTSVTDLSTQKHYYNQDFVLCNNNIITTLGETSYGSKAGIKYAANETSDLGSMLLSMSGKEYELELTMNALKPPVWHCEDGKLQMGILDDPKQRTYYFSFTNIITEGMLVLEGKKHEVRGKAWFDKQGGTYELTNPKTNWEWFSFRFFDDEEIMLFYFPQNEYKDGTYIKSDGEYERLNNYNAGPLDFIVEPETKYTFSRGWKISMPGIKDGEYTVVPKTDGQFNIFFYELLADVFNENGDLVGYCYVELLPGARNDKLDSSLAFKRK